MPRESVILECTEARKEGKPPSRYVYSEQKLQTDPVEKRSTTVSSKGIRFIGKLKLIYFKASISLDAISINDALELHLGLI